MDERRMGEKEGDSSSIFFTGPRSSRAFDRGRFFLYQTEQEEEALRRWMNSKGTFFVLLILLFNSVLSTYYLGKNLSLYLS